MKRCPTCNQTYADDTMSFCLSDGAPLLSDAGDVNRSSQATLVYTNPHTGATAQQRPGGTNPLHGNQPAPNWSQPQYSMGQQPQKRSALPWILGGGILLLLIFGGLAGVAVLLLGSSRKPEKTDVQVRPVVSSSNSGNTSTTNNNYANANNSNGSGTNNFAREGRYTGTATNTTNTPNATGDAEIQIADFNDLTGSMKMKMKFTNGLCGEGESFGVMDKKTGEISLFGSLGTKGGECGETTWVITTRCTFGTTDALNCTYRLTGVGQPQTGSFEVTRQ
jgi:hypothetical protein